MIKKSKELHELKDFKNKSQNKRKMWNYNNIKLKPDQGNPGRSIKFLQVHASKIEGDSIIVNSINDFLSNIGTGLASEIKAPEVTPQDACETIHILFSSNLQVLKK